ncbi:MAG: cardiolipin synthase [Clostridiaceae bacterium]|nr:cardiolipin synthase [Clostridiaceae bacterium]
MRKVLKILFSRLMVMSVLMIFQIALLIILTVQLSTSFFYLYFVFSLLSLTVVCFIASQRSSPAHKLAWVIPILIFPVFGGVLYILIMSNRNNKKFRDKLNTSHKESISYLTQQPYVMNELYRQDRNAANQSGYILRTSGFPVYNNSHSIYFSSGEEFFVTFVDELKKAEKYIFIETFLIREGLMWNTVLSILEDKAAKGVDVRVMYDDAGCMTTLPHKYYKRLRAKGIKCYAFNPFTPLPEVRLNNRDHRKIIVIDGYTAFTGGINFADEYINVFERCGHWKDSAIMVKGEAAWNMNVMFLQLWSSMSNEPVDYDLIKTCTIFDDSYEPDGYIQPFGDSPFYKEAVGENTYINMISRARDYVYIFTPYLVLDHQLITALRLAANSGVDVRIVTPHIPDKWYVFLVTQSYYEDLIEAGIKIFEYSPGFLHSKTFVCDDVFGIVGSINLDYRSLYFHFECGVWLYKTKSVKAIKNDFIETFKKCKEITLEECLKVKLLKRIARGFLRLFAPLM